MTPDIDYHDLVRAYLASELGSDTPQTVATRLLTANADGLGLSDRPSMPALHALRAWLEAIERDPT